MHLQDNDECTAETDMCAQVCHDTQGSYTCTCQPGYTLTLDTRTCNGTLSLAQTRGMAESLIHTQTQFLTIAILYQHKNI